MLFKPRTERERIYAAMTDWPFALDYLRGVDWRDNECRMVSRGIHAAKIEGVGCGEVYRILIHSPHEMLPSADVISLAIVTEKGCEWFRRLISEHRDMKQEQTAEKREAKP